MTGRRSLRLLVVDDERPALEELAWLLRRDPRVATVRTAADGATALSALQDDPADALFLDIRMPGLNGLELARVLSRFRRPPQVVFVTAYDDHAVDAFEVAAVDYLLKPVHEERLAEAVRRLCEGLDTVPAEPGDETIPVELGGVTRFVSRSEVRYVDAHGDYARLHTAEGSHLVRVPLGTLETQWKHAGFLRIHRSHLVSLRHIEELRFEAGRMVVRVAGEELPVSRRHTRGLRDTLVRRARPDPAVAGGTPVTPEREATDP